MTDGRDPAARPDLRALRRRPLFAPLLVPALGLLLVFGAGYGAWTLQRTTTVIVVRHAEKVADGSADPALAPAGAARALRLAGALRDAQVTAIYVTATQRSQDTAAPLATQNGVLVTVVDGKDVDALVDRIHREHRGETVLVVGHSNTVGPIVRALGGVAPETLDDSDYDELFVVTEPTFGRSTTLRLREM